MAHSPRSTLSLVLGVVMLGLGTFILLRLLWTRGLPITNTILLDIAFAALFLLRGWSGLQNARRLQQRALDDGPGGPVGPGGGGAGMMGPRR
jgi:hypothetical protein